MKSRIRTVRNYLGLSQEEFGKKLGVSRSVIVNAELGRAKPNNLFIRHISDVYSVNLKWLETGEGEMLIETESAMEPRERFQCVRNWCNLSMTAFGEKIGLSASGVSAIEYGTRNMSAKHIKLICAAFPEINESWLRTGEGAMLSESTSTLLDALATRHNLTPMERGIISRFVEIDADRRSIFLDVVRRLFDAGDIAAAESSADLVEKRSCPPGSETMSG